MGLTRNPNRVGGPNTCKLIETQTLQVLSNEPYQIEIPGIVGTRPQAVAPNFGLYRIAKVIFKYKPYYDTYTPGIVNSIPGNNYITTVPVLYWKMNRFADAPANFTAQNMRDLGARPFRLDDKTVTVAYKPNILLASASGGSDSGQLKMTPWLNTDNAPDTPAFAVSTTQHYGHFFYIEANLVNTSTQPYVASLDITIVYEFKNPRVSWSESQGTQQTVQRPLALLTSK